MALRRFLYRNDATVDDYLGQLELGVADAEVHTQTRERNGKVEFEVPIVNVGLAAVARHRGRGTERSSDRLPLRSVVQAA